MTDLGQPLRASICIPTYNRREILRATLESLRQQTEPAENFEVIVGDDGSTDDTVEMVRALALSSPFRLRCLSHSNAGPAAASNLSAASAENEILIFLDDDQLCSPQLVSAHLDAHRRLGPVLVQGLFPLTEECRTRGGSLMYERSLLASLQPIDREHEMSPFIWSANISLPKSAWERIGGLDVSFREYGGEDTDLGLRIAELGFPIVFVPAAYSLHVHVMGYDTLKRQALAEGHSLVRLARKFGQNLTYFSGGSVNSARDRVFGGAWRWAPKGTALFADAFGGILLLADRFRVTPVQLLAARAIHRLYKVRGIREELAAGPDEVKVTVEGGHRLETMGDSSPLP